ncbi:O-antigen ligase family protein [Paraconexibacter sp.]|uniref:O-antigen ligase family protein n=1 Tax=Paraconexibacter sp. TaxID=2949640 RepID=UPI00356A9921
MRPTRDVAGLFRAAPVTIPCLVIVAAFGLWVFDDGGYPVSAWSPVALLALGLLGVGLATIPNAWGDVPAPVRIVAGGLAAFTVWSYASMAWADDAGAALEDANRTLMYLAVFVVFGLWRQRERTAAIVVGAWTLVMLALGFVMLLQLAGTGHDATDLFGRGDRLADPTGYPNAAAALWLMVLWPAVTLAASARVPWVLRATFAAGATLLIPLALLSQSRGSLFALPITLVLFLALFPGRVRHIGVLTVVALAAAPAIPSVLDVADLLGETGEGDASPALERVAFLTFAGACAAALVVGALAAWESRRPPGPAAVDRLRLGGRIAAGGVVASVLVASLVLAGNPVSRVQDGWDSFKGGYGDNATSGSRLVGGLGSNRYDFYRVGLKQFQDEPVVGHGGGSFRQAYLRRGRSTETPRYAHSVQLRTLSEYGLVGAAILLVVLIAAAVAAARALRAGDALARAVIGGALGSVLYWLVHGSADWFWEFAGLGAPTFALLGVVCALVPRPEPPRSAVLRLRTPAELGGLAVGLCALGLMVLGPWAANREIAAAAESFATRPLESYTRLDRAADLDPFSDRPALLEGSIALRYGDLERAEAAFSRALGRVPDGQYATLQLGAIASVQGDRDRAETLLRRAVALAPRDRLARAALDVVRDGGIVDLPSLSRAILAGAAPLAP